MKWKYKALLFILIFGALIFFGFKNAEATNDWDTYPAVIDTAEAVTDVYRIYYFEWHPNAADDDLEIQDAGGNVLWKIRAAIGAPNHESYGIEINKINRMDVSGITVVTIDGGTLYIHGHIQ